MPRFSIVVVHYQGTVSNEEYLRGQKSLDAQTYRDFEVLRYHDGPLLDPSIQQQWPIKCTPQRFNDWGHSLRDQGIREAMGEYILHFNADNILYPNALEEIDREINRPSRIKDTAGTILDTNDIIIFPIKMWGLVKFKAITWQMKTRRDFYYLMTGHPPVLQNIDCMQLVMKRELWLKEGGWRDKRELGDGYMYTEFADRYGYRLVSEPLGEHY